eukprot:743588-Amphidinium_carterae.2
MVGGTPWLPPRWLVELAVLAPEVARPVAEGRAGNYAGGMVWREGHELWVLRFGLRQDELVACRVCGAYSQKRWGLLGRACR